MFAFQTGELPSDLLTLKVKHYERTIADTQNEKENMIL